MPVTPCLTVVGLRIETANIFLDEDYVRDDHLGASTEPHVMNGVTDTGTGMEPSPTSTRTRIDVHTGERTLLRRLKTQALSGTLVATRGDTMPLAVQPGADPLRVPRSIVRDLYVSRGTPNRFESAVRRAAVPTVVSAALTALSLSVRQGTGDPSPARGALSAAPRPPCSPAR